MKRVIIPGTLPTGDMHQYLLGTVAPRPIALVSTVDAEGRSNLAPYSFFNAFSSNPPILVFSSNRRVEDNTTKDTLHNVRATGECVVSAVSYSIVRQMMLCSVELPAGVSEFDWSGFTQERGEVVAAPLVAESPVNMECKVTNIITLGEHGGAGHLIVCEVLRMHIREDVLDVNGKIDPQRIDLVGRMGRAFYVRASGDAVMAMPQSQKLPVVGYPGLPEHIRQSHQLSANDVATLAGGRSFPARDEARREVMDNPKLAPCLNWSVEEIHRKASELIRAGDAELAARLLAAIESR